jgi:hypothetical protein
MLGRVINVTRVIRMRDNATGVNEKDGLQKQVEMLGALSKQLDEYFAMKTFGTDSRYR